MGSPLSSTSVMTRWVIVIYHHRTSTGWIVSIMGCESTSTIDQGSKAVLGKSSQENKILTDCSTVDLLTLNKTFLLKAPRLRSQLCSLLKLRPGNSLGNSMNQTHCGLL